ncbi:amino acid ABC transporter substrate-binding protein [Puniceicoccales bacterium CK1056]|uniref:Amino acid ABC transporter substrate-binding protein n=2 Tax=Oceanipulchritudo coccoides TaxID=2706888 RepID=A0A6B2M1J7_9BACT|nr:amino acid ABC transporter substrate-binding protein [Oceanipulchritudo coccoides]
MEIIDFWNGNKSESRQGYELELLEACLCASEVNGSYELRIDNTDYPLAEDEGNIFRNGADILVTVAGNVKFRNREKIVISRPLAKGLLGYRLLIVRSEDADRFKGIKEMRELQELSIGIPETWADADLFRSNQFSVVEKGSFEELFHRLKGREFDYTALGANEIESAFNEHAQPLGGLQIEPSLMIYYSFPLVFYVHPDKRQLAERVESGLQALIDSGEFDDLFAKYHGDIVERLNLKNRRTFTLQNPVLPEEMMDFRSALLD